MADATTEAPAEVDEAPAPESESYFTRKKLFRCLLSVVTIAAILWYVPKVADFSTVWGYITDMTPLELVILALFALWNLMTYWICMVATTPGMTYPQAMVVVESSTAISNTVPAGSALAIGLQYSMMSSWGFSKSPRRSRCSSPGSGTTSPSSPCQCSRSRSSPCLARSEPDGCSPGSSGSSRWSSRW